MAAAASSGSSSPAGEHGSYREFNPLPLKETQRPHHGLCSMPEVDHVVARLQQPESTQLIASVAFFVNAMESGSGAPIIRAASSRAS